MHLNFPQAEISVLFLKAIKEFKNNVTFLLQFSTLRAILEMWALREVLPAPSLSFPLTPYLANKVSACKYWMLCHSAFLSFHKLLQPKSV